MMLKLLVVATLLGENFGAANYIGCFQDTIYEDVANSSLSDDTSLKKCIQFCLSESYKFASHQDHRGCYCGESFGQGSLPEGRCYAYCPDALAVNCVGQYSSTLWYIPQTRVAESTNGNDSDDAASGESNYENESGSSPHKRKRRQTQRPLYFGEWFWYQMAARQSESEFKKSDHIFWYRITFKPLVSSTVKLRTFSQSQTFFHTLCRMWKPSILILVKLHI